MHIKSSMAFVIYVISMLGAYVFTGFFKEAPYLTFATQLTIGFGVFITKRLFQKHSRFNGE